MSDTTGSPVRRAAAATLGWVRAYGTVLFHLAVSMGVGIALGNVFDTAGAAAAGRATTGPVPAVSCPACPAGHGAASVEVQERPGSTLVVARGNWPASVGGLEVDVAVDLGDEKVRLHPDARSAAFQVVDAPKGRTIAAGLVPGALVVNVSPAMGTPHTIFTLLAGDREVQRVDSSAAPPVTTTTTTASTTSSPTTTAPSTTTAAPAPFDPTDVVAACRDLDGPAPATIAPTGLSHGVSEDPRLHRSRPFVGVTYQGPNTRPAPGAPPMVIVAVLDAAPAGGGNGTRLIDRLGDTQLYLYWDGAKYDKALRTWDGRRWTLDMAAPAALTNAVGATSTRFWYEPLPAGTPFGVIVATADGCQALGITAAGRLTGQR